MVISDKPQAERIKECVHILREIVGLGIPIHAPEVQELKQHIDSYIKEGVCWSGSVNFSAYGRIAEVDLPRRADKFVEVTLRKPRIS